ncbi:MAG: hypothetical protein P4L10_12960, partial [Acidobacteriaceae bacterium]|nr:hypothetical protein [Acidobacteriaceae bacterium]
MTITSLRTHLISFLCAPFALGLFLGAAGSPESGFQAEAQTPATSPTTAWKNGNFDIDVKNVVARSAIV